MMFLCIKCHGVKSGQPYHSAATKRWLCARCSSKSIREREAHEVHLNDQKKRLEELMNSTDKACASKRLL